ncbi:MAG: N-6 DNA methylase [Parasphingorhabdus sp.]
MNRTTYNLARMNMLLHDIHYSRFDLRQEDTLTQPQLDLDMRFADLGGGRDFRFWSLVAPVRRDEIQ